ncbi:hypothetical protein [Alteromonas macleodii]|jgi:hypothetical protein|uniref:hypothetical protein n=1 Tax=Alteromonas macleodii TaxID=28108 RepID=UPI000BDB8FE0|nr:hypothetical protein [Alteromonas macleodii]AUI84675.1 hypothetical protein TE101_20070 [Alteromonas macleodii]OZB95780.1 hypothetical protein BBP29_19315 [Alteromonas macleodii]
MNEINYRYFNFSLNDKQKQAFKAIYDSRTTEAIINSSLKVFCVERDYQTGSCWNIESLSWSEATVIEKFAIRSISAWTQQIRYRGKGIKPSAYLSNIEKAIESPTRLDAESLFPVMQNIKLHKSILEEIQSPEMKVRANEFLQDAKSISLIENGDVMLGVPRSEEDLTKSFMFLRCALPNISPSKIKYDSEKVGKLIPVFWK